MPIRQKKERSLYNRLNTLSQRNMPRQHAPATPPICVNEKKTKNAAPNATHTHFCAAEPTSRNKIAAGTRNRRKYAKVLKIMHQTSSPSSRTRFSSNEDGGPSGQRPRLRAVSNP